MAVGDQLRYVRPGDPLEIQASTWNLVMDATRAHHGLRGNVGAIEPTTTRNPNWVFVKNMTDYDIRRFEAVALAEPIFSPTDNLDEFENHFAFHTLATGELATFGFFGVAQEPIAVGSIGYCAIAGTTCAIIHQIRSEHMYAEINNTFGLSSAPFGSARILWKEGTGQDKRCVIRFGDCCWDAVGVLETDLARGNAATAMLCEPQPTPGSGGLGDCSMYVEHSIVEIIDTGLIPAEISPLPGIVTSIHASRMNGRWVLTAYDCDAV